MADYTDLSPLRDILNPATRAASQASRRKPAPALDEEEEKSVVQSLRDASLSTVGAIGNTLDLPGSVIRDVGSMIATGKWVNPIDQFLNPFSSENRTTGKQLLEQTGLAGKTDTWGKSIAGFGVEVATDPLSLLTFGGSALGRVGQAAKKVGALEDITRVAAKKANAAPGSIGKREARLTTSIQDIATYGTGKAKANAQDMLKDLTPEEAIAPVGGLVGFGAPFRQPSKVFGTGKTAVSAARKVDAMGRALRYGKIPGTDRLNPIGAAMSLFDVAGKGARTADVAAYASTVSKAVPESQEAISFGAANQAMAMEKMISDVNSPAFDELANAINSRYWMGGQDFRKMSTADKEMALSDLLREAEEGEILLEDVPDTMRWIPDQMRGDVERMPGEMRRAGGRVMELTDTSDYAARFASSPKKILTSKDLQASTFDPSQNNKRLDFLREIPGGTVALRRKIIMDPRVAEIVKNNEGVDVLANHLRNEHSSWLSDEYTGFFKSGKRKGQPYVKKNRYGKMAQMLYKQDPEVLKRGLFGNNVAFDHAARMTAHSRAVQTLRGLGDFLAETEQMGVGRYIKPESEWQSLGSKVGTADDDTMKFSKFLKMMDLPAQTTHKMVKKGRSVKGGMYKAVARKLGVDPRDLRGYRIDKRIAEDLIGIHKATSGRGPFDEILAHVDSFTNFTKSLLTGPWPGYMVRNAVGGYVENASLGMWDNETAKWGIELQLGKVLKGSTKLEFTAQEYANRARKAGMLDDDIKKQLGSAGYSDEKITQFLGKAPKAPKRTNLDPIELEADQLLQKIDSGSAMPAMITSNLRRIASGVGVNITPTMKPEDVVAAIRQARQSAIKPKYAQPVGDFNDEFATEVVGQKAYSEGVVGSVDADRLGAVTGTGERETGTLEEVLSGVPRAGRKSMSPYRVVSKFFGREPGTTIDPRKMFRVRGVYGRMQSELGPVVAGEEMGAFVEGAVRLQPWLALAKRGYGTSEAARKVAGAQVAYSNKNFTPFELKYMTRLFPFYKFSRSKIPFHMKQLIEKPGGVHAQIIRAMNLGQSQGELAPDYVRDTASMSVSQQNPILSSLIGEAPEGTDRYLSGLGLMIEDLLSIGPGVRGTGQEALSRLNPMIKGPMEYFTNQSFFQAGPEGGRPLDELDPMLGRILSNVTGQAEPVQLPQLLEVAAANSPFSRLLTTVRTLTDPRKKGDYGALSEALPFNLPGVPAALNLLTGVRVTDISPGAKDAVVRDLLNAEMKRTGASVFERINYTKAELAKMSPKEREAAITLQALANTIIKRTKKRAEQQKQEQ